MPERMRQVEPTGAAEAPPPGFIETLGAGFRTAKDDIGFVQDSRLQEAYLPVLKALTEANGKDAGDYRTWSKKAGAFINPFAGAMDEYDLDAVWSDIEEARAKNPQLLSGLPKSREEFERSVLTREGKRAADLRTVERGSGIAAFVGGVGAMPFDPINIATAPFGGNAKTLGQAVLREAIANMAVEAVQQVPLARARERMGEELTAKEAAINIGAAGVFGGLFGGGQHVIGKNWDAIKAMPRDLQEKAWAKIIENSPSLQARLGSKMDWDAIGDADLPDLAEAIIGVDNLSSDERAAIAILRRDAQIDEANPFLPDGAGVAAHRGELAKALQDIMDAVPGASRPVAAGRSSSSPTGPLPRLRGGTAISSGTVAGDAFAVVKSRIGIVESGGNNAAKNPRSTATGKYQFISGTWLNLYKRRFGDQGLSDAEILAKRGNVRLQEILMDDLMQANAQALRDRGHAADAGNLYLAHFAGSKGASKILSSDPNASVRAVLGQAVVDANPFLRNYSAADLIQWAHRKMTGKGAAPAGRARGGDFDPEAANRDWISREQERIDAELARLDGEALRQAQGERQISDIVDDAIDERPPMFEIERGPDIEPSRPIEPVARTPDAPPAEVMAILPELRKIVADRTANQSLSNLKPLARSLGVSEDELRQGLLVLAARGEVRMRYNKDAKPLFSRLPRDNGPIDILTFIGRAGVLSEDGLDDAGRKLGTKGHALGKGGRDWNRKFISGSGPLIRKAGRSIDDIGEALHEAGYFGDPQGPRPSESDILDAIEDAVQGRRKIFPFAQERAPSAALFDHLEDIDREYMRRDFDAVADEMTGTPLTDDEFARAVDEYLASREFDPDEGIDIAEAINRMANREYEAIQRALYHELEGDSYDAYDDEFAQAWLENGGFDGEDFRGQPDFGGDARTGGAGSAAGQGPAQAPIELDPQDFDPFTDPAEGPGAATQLGSLDHDARAMADDMFGGPTQAEKRQALERKGEGGLSTDKEQKPVGSDGGLFDPDSWNQIGFRMDEEGDAINPADLLAEFDAEDAILKNIKDCL